MLTRNMLKSKKAISPILATLLLIVIAVAAIVVTYAWIMTYMGTTTQQASIILYDENVRFVDSTTTEITIGNSGTGDTQIVRLYLGTSANDLTEVTTAVTDGLNKALEAGSVVTLTLNWTDTDFGNWTEGETYHFRVVPQQGQAYPFSAQAPQ
ncbi:MAG TPA: archaellin/type IV pilin N-terminal domain-containing protein [Candidatus Bathyarchaeia archaeon]|nr:archaellin/type IV pilin N-terminal domain-containing protein [Candidatus Bathyarchaeia archaeon]